MAGGAPLTPLAPVGPLAGGMTLPLAPGPAMLPGGLTHLPWNLTYAPRLLAATSPPTSAVFAEPPPSVPATVPTVLTLLSDSRNTTLSQNFSAPTGTWARILLNYTGQAVGGVYDSSYRAYLDRSLVLFGTTPEYGTWTVQKDVTEYSVVFRGTFNLTFLLGAAVTSGYFLSSLSISFYPVPAGASPPATPTEIVPLWYRQVLSPTSPTVYDPVNVPTNVTNATIELYLYGFGPDEFWYTGSPGLRVVQIAANGTEVGSLLPFPYLNTGGIDLFTWRPIPAAFTLDDRPYRFNVTAALGFLEGARNLSAHLGSIPTGADWIIGGSLLLTTASNASAASAGDYSFSSPAPVITTDGKSYYDETATVALHYSSLVGLPGGPANVTLWTNQSFSSSLTYGQSWLGATWSNLSFDEKSHTSESTLAPVGNFTETHAYDFPFAMNKGDAFVETSSNNGSYPIYGNFTSYFDNVHQEWNESTSAGGPTVAAVRSASVDDRVTAAINSYAGYEELTAPNAGLILSISFIEAQTTKFYTQSAGGPLGGSSYAHLLIGASYQPTDPFQAETILTNVVSAPLVERVQGTPSELDVGGTVVLSVSYSGGSGPYTISWLGLPPGCASAESAELSCNPSVPGSYEVSALVRDSQGALAPVGTVSLQVNPLPTIALSGNRSVVDLGGTIEVFARVGGGTGSLTCEWSTSVNAWSPAMTCSLPFQLTPAVPGTTTVQGRVLDSAGGLTTATPGFTVIAYPPPSIALEPPPSLTSVVGKPVALNSDVTGGSGGFTYSWLLNGSAYAGFNGSSLSFVPTAPGNYTFSVRVVDSAGGNSTSAEVTLLVHSPPPARGTSGTSGPSLPGGLDWYAFLALGIAVGLCAGIALMRLLQPRRPAPAAPRRQPSPPPSP